VCVHVCVCVCVRVCVCACVCMCVLCVCECAPIQSTKMTNLPQFVNLSQFVNPPTSLMFPPFPFLLFFVFKAMYSRPWKMICLCIQKSVPICRSTLLDNICPPFFCFVFKAMYSRRWIYWSLIVFKNMPQFVDLLILPPFFVLYSRQCIQEIEYIDPSLYSRHWLRLVGSLKL